jgi:hypothetical protein
MALKALSKSDRSHFLKLRLVIIGPKMAMANISDYNQIATTLPRAVARDEAL